MINPEILDLTALSPIQIRVAAKKPGATQINLWDENEELHSFDVAVLSEEPERNTDDDSQGKTEPTAPDDQPVKVHAVKVKREAFIVKSAQPCSLVASRIVSLYARVSGVITRRNVELGDLVKKGDVLAEIDAPEVAEDVLIAQADADEADAARMQAEASVGVAQATIEEAQAALAQRQAEIAASAVQVAKRKNALVYTQKLKEKNVVSEYETNDKVEDLKAAEAEEHSVKSSMAAAAANLSRAKAQFEAAKAAARVAQLRAAAARRHLERIRQHTEYLQIRAPIDGAVTDIRADVGSLTAGGKGEPLFVLSAVDKLVAITYLPERDALRVKRGDSVTLRFDALPKRTITATMSRLAYAFDPQLRTLRTEIDLDNREGLLRPGMFGIAAVHLETHPNVFTVPHSTRWVKDSSGHTFVYRVVDGRAVETLIEVVSDRGHAMEVKGLDEGDVVISDLVSGGLRDDMPVEVENVEAD